MILQLGRGPLEGGLEAAILRHVQTLTDRDGLVVDFDIPRERLPVSTRTETELFGIAREALTNVAKHAGARTATVRAHARGASVVLEISDDGRGFDPSCDHPGHFGLESMRGRAAQVGGRLDIASGQGRGTVVRVEVAADRG
jgi:signal transduction histidine kinase